MKRNLLEITEENKNRFDRLKANKGMTVNGLIKWLIDLGEKQG